MAGSSFFQRNEPIKDLIRIEIPGRSQTEINVKIKVNKDVFIPMKVTNISEKHIAWRFRINTRGRYMVKPRRQGCLRNGESIDLQIVLTAFKEYPSAETLLKPDKFLVQATAVRETIPTEQQDRITALWKDREKVHKKKSGVYAFQEALVKCRLVLPPEVEATTTYETSRSNAVVGGIEPSATTSASQRNGPGSQPGAKSQLEKWKRKEQDYDKLLEYTVKLSEEKEQLQERLQKQVDRNKKLMQENKERLQRLQRLESNLNDEKLDDDGFVQNEMASSLGAHDIPEIASDPPICNTAFFLLALFIGIVSYMLGQYAKSCPDAIPNAKGEL